jgi:anti-anti-sigma factor
MTPAVLQIVVESQGAARAIRLAGRLTAETVSQFESVCGEVPQDGSAKLVLDCTALEYLSSAGLCTVLRLGKQMRASGSTLVLAVPPGGVRQVLELAGFAAMFPVCETYEQAWLRLANAAQISLNTSGPVPVIAVAGRIDAERLPEFESFCRIQLQQGTSRLVLDFSQLEYLSSAGLRGILDLGRQLKQRQGKLAICIRAGPVAKVLEIAGLAQLFPIRDTLEEAAWEAR